MNALRWMRGLLLLLAVVTLTAGFTIVIVNAEPGPVLRVSGLLVATAGAAALVAVIRAGRPRLPSRFEAGKATGTAAHRPEELLHLERTVRLARGTAFDVHFRLRPLLREAAAHRLHANHGIELDDRPADARRLLGDDAWQLLQADARPPPDPWAPGIAVERLSALLDAMERT